MGEAVVGGWIWGYSKRQRSEGWVPMSAIGLLPVLAEDVSDGEHVSRTSSGKGPLVNTTTSAGSTDSSSQEVAAAVAGGILLPSGKDGHKAGETKGAGTSKANQSFPNIPTNDDTHKEDEESEGWHNHGNWWSKQRHLKVSDTKAAQETQKKGSTSSSSGGGG
eukprot:CAMPEP_0206614586 /NCGR_PEP_ID=MMETSP0325_2-20121206/57498_1 /ASSEMBLY_ACC=CAM_ASM_000347 /TAXON_ID=2866 /ORGANISM="Crypthecodinium cohnii, Strain Seligo" /LENGTH=162 /DNA_ID=CAMNT_0054135147 /DNA_START=8 /DNA_END=492 /DNA_ORIENTATION=+